MERLTLGNALKEAVLEQDKDRKIVKDLGKQAKEKPANTTGFRKAMSLATEPGVQTVMTKGSSFVHCIHSAWKCHAPGKYEDSYDEHYITAMGDRVNGKDPDGVKVKDLHFEWQKATPIVDASDISNIWSFYDEDSNRRELFDARNHNKAAEVDIPKMPLIPYKITLKIVSKPTTPWELYKMILEFAEDRAQEVKDLMTQIQNWCLVATTRGDICFLAGPIVDTYLSDFIFPFFYVGILKRTPQLCDGRWPIRWPTSDVGLRRQPQPWQVDTIKNHGGAIGFPLAMVIFFKLQLGRSLPDITVRIRPSAFNQKIKSSLL